MKFESPSIFRSCNSHRIKFEWLEREKVRLLDSLWQEALYNVFPAPLRLNYDEYGIQSV